MSDEPFSSCCGMLFVKLKQARGDLASFARTCNYPASEKQLAKIRQLKKTREECYQALKDHQADPTIEHGHNAKPVPELR